jgi:hypothetical protein
VILQVALEALSGAPGEGTPGGGGGAYEDVPGAGCPVISMYIYIYIYMAVSILLCGPTLLTKASMERF